MTNRDASPLFYACRARVGRHDAAADALGRAAELLPRHPAVLHEWAKALQVRAALCCAMLCHAGDLHVVARNLVRGVPVC